MELDTDQPPLDLVTEIHLAGLSLVTGLTDLVHRGRLEEAEALVGFVAESDVDSIARPASTLADAVPLGISANDAARAGIASNLARDEARLICSMAVVYIVAHAEAWRLRWVSSLRAQIEPSLAAPEIKGWRDLADWLRDTCGSALAESQAWLRFNEGLQRRHLIVHNGGLVDDLYVKRTGEGVAGQSLQTDVAYVKALFDSLVEVMRRSTLEVAHQYDLALYHRSTEPRPDYERIETPWGCYVMVPAELARSWDIRAFRSLDEHD